MIEEKRRFLKSIRHWKRSYKKVGWRCASLWRSLGGLCGAVRPWRHFCGGGTMGYAV